MINTNNTNRMMTQIIGYLAIASLIGSLYCFLFLMDKNPWPAVYLILLGVGSTLSLVGVTRTGGNKEPAIISLILAVLMLVGFIIFTVPVLLRHLG